MNALPATAEPGPVIEHADALDWLAARQRDRGHLRLALCGGLAGTRPEDGAAATSTHSSQRRGPVQGARGARRYSDEPPF